MDFMVFRMTWFFLCVPKICVACVFLFYNFAVSKESSCSSHEGCDGTTGKVFASCNCFLNNMSQCPTYFRVDCYLLYWLLLTHNYPCYKFIIDIIIKVPINLFFVYLLLVV